MSLLRVAWIASATLTLGACSLITSLSGLEGDANDGGAPKVDAGFAGSDATASDAKAADASSADASANARDASVLADGSTAPSDASPPECMADVVADPANCGACGHDCQGGSCTSGFCGPVTLAVTHGSVGIAIDSTFVYFADNDAGVLYKVSKSLTRTGVPTPVVSGTAAQSVQGIASDGTYVYWTNKTASGTVHRALPTGAALTTIASAQPQPDWIASNGTTVAWTNQTGNQVMSAPTDSDGGAAPTQLNLVGESGTVLAGIAMDPGNVYYAAKTAGGGLAERVPLDGGPVSELGTPTYVSVAIDGVNAYWTGGAANPSVYQNIKTGAATTQTTIGAGALICPLGVVSDGTDVYFIDQGDPSCAFAAVDASVGAGALYRIPVGHVGALPGPLVTGLTESARDRGRRNGGLLGQRRPDRRRDEAREVTPQVGGDRRRGARTALRPTRSLRRAPRRLRREGRGPHGSSAPRARERREPRRWRCLRLRRP